MKFEQVGGGRRSQWGSHALHHATGDHTTTAGVGAFRTNRRADERMDEMRYGMFATAVTGVIRRNGYERLGYIRLG